MGTVAFLFPGQGSQKLGMGLELYERSASAREVFHLANEVLGFSLSDLMFQGPSERLVETQFAQPAILTHSIAVLETLREEGHPAPDFAAGHSLGEYSALVAASVFSFADAVKAVHLRGQFMQDAVPMGVGAMAAVLALDPQAIEEVCATISMNGPDMLVEVANYNGPDQTVISGTVAGVNRAMHLLKEKGAKRVMPLSVSAPFHCRLMQPAADRLSEHLRKIDFREPHCRFINNVSADFETDPTRIRDFLVEQVVAPVKFTQMLEGLKEAGAEDFIEIGPGKVLSGIIRRTLTNVNISSKES